MRKSRSNIALGVSGILIGSVLTATTGAILSGFCAKNKNTAPDYLIVLGARTKDGEPTSILQSRIRAAAEFLTRSESTVALLSGGITGASELSEARCMRDALVSLGIPEERIILEERSRTTRENLLYSLMLIPESASVVLLTNDFHAFRACRHAIRKGVRASVETVRCPKNDLPLAFLREELAVIVEFFLGRL